jgi:hypothetical protein
MHTFIDGSPGDRIKLEGGINFIYGAQDLEKVLVIGELNALSRLTINVRYVLQHLLVLGAVESGIGQNHRAEAVLAYAPHAVLPCPHIAVLELHADDLVLEALLKADELVHGEQALQIVAEKVLVQTRVVANHTARHVGVLVALAQRGLVSNDRLQLLELLQVDVAVAVQVEHVKGYGKVTRRSF